MKGKSKSKFPGWPSTKEFNQITKEAITRISNQNYLPGKRFFYVGNKAKMGNKNVVNAFGKCENAQDISAEEWSNKRCYKTEKWVTFGSSFVNM